MKIYTGEGDKGYTSLRNSNDKYKKSDLIFEVLGCVDELSASLGHIHASQIRSFRIYVFDIQKTLFSLGSTLSDNKLYSIDHTYWKAEIKKLEQNIDILQKELPELSNFILPGGCFEASHFHTARTICRRLERRIVEYINYNEEFSYKELIVYINRLSDFLFVLARYSNQLLGYRDVEIFK